MDSKLSSAFSSTPLSAHGPRWSSFWDESYTPWDRAGPSAALLDILATRPDLVPPPPPPSPSSDLSPPAKPTALVPGCGRGHDALLLANMGYDVLALDFSPTAIAQARQNQQLVESGGRGDQVSDLYRARQQNGAEPGSVTWASGDFFDSAWLDNWPSTTFDLIFDYTFLCALAPSARPLWAARVTALLAPTTGRLVCLEFPSGKPLSTPGPPWGLTPEIYLALLARPGDPVSFSSSTTDGDAHDVVVIPAPSGGGLRRLELVKPARTHAAGTNEDGTVRDWIHVWSH
ncbi:putative thiol methyltransferase 2 [Colletotrichum orbiculare MAFF 240422]|uniref:Thiol methyltransferase 2 n=1 Tax=Colletotrichum orbiculare (strain 104-T / ATCC 96160 / CBS 514.97 / LARS 414 / MAFF 240422) TaxID=1213857 RepID=N4VME7_COLOR|nr:putative thiol methyltransferase 2 [Colletotrichum orbiculare MAFF 240422]